MVRFGLAILLALAISACSKGSPTAPSNNTPAPTPTPTLYTISGTVRLAGGPPISGATVRVDDGPNAGLSVQTDGSGAFTLSGLQFAGFTVSVSHPEYDTLSRGGLLTQGQTTVNTTWNMRPAVAWSATGTGDNVFTIPSWVTRVRITGEYTRNSSNFIVRIGGRLTVNELLGTGWSMTHFAGTYQITPGLVEIVSSSGVAWTFVEQR